MEVELIDLKREYTRINRRYYEGRLPKVSEITLQWSARMPRDGDAVCHVHGITDCDKYCPKVCRRHIIRLHPDLKRNDRDAEFRLQHEMVHLSAVLGNRWLVFHGNQFKARMRELAGLGAFDALW
jgi:hypothetical protein